MDQSSAEINILDDLALAFMGTGCDATEGLNKRLGQEMPYLSADVVESLLKELFLPRITSYQVPRNTRHDTLRALDLATGGDWADLL